MPPDLTQEEHLEGLPIGTRGGAVSPTRSRMDGEYEIQIRLTRDRDEHVEGLTEPHELELLLDRARVQVFTVQPAAARAANTPPSISTSRSGAGAGGPAHIGVAFLKKPSLLLETARQPYQAHFNSYRHPRIQPAVYSISIIGPYGAATPATRPAGAEFSARGRRAAATGRRAPRADSRRR